MKALRFLVLLVVMVALGTPLLGSSLALVVAQEAQTTVSVFALNGVLLTTLSPTGGFTFPTAAAFDSSGHVWVSDYVTSTLYEFSIYGVYMGYITGPGIVNPVGLAIAADGDLLVVDRNSGKICEVNPTTGTTVGTCISVTSFARSVAVNGNEVYVGSEGAAVVDQYTVGLPGTFVWDASAAALYPRGIAIDSSGNVYVSAADAPNGDGFANEVVQFNSALGGESVFADGFQAANGLAFDPAGNLYVVDYSAGTITKFDSSGTNLGTVVTGLTHPSGLAEGEWGPEPGTWLMLALGLGALALRRRRR
ncbi:MAG: SMP-30/gluconolactonase/LRE family protein [Bryobacteraceae bacterium]